LRARQAIYVCALVLSALAAVLIWGGWGGPARAIVGVSLVCLLPGLATVTLLDLDLDLRTWDAVAISCAVSLAIVVLVGIALGALHLGFGSHEWVTALAGIAATLSIAGLVVEGLGSGDAITQSEGTAFPRVRIDFLFYATALGVTALAIVVAHRDAVRHLASTSLAELWMLPTHPAALSDSVQVGVRNRSTHTQSFKLVLATPRTRVTQALTLPPGASHVQGFTVGSMTQQGPIVAHLYASTSTGVATETATLPGPASVKQSTIKTRARSVRQLQARGKKPSVQVEGNNDNAYAKARRSST
jgi:hypothetical protein